MTKAKKDRNGVWTDGAGYVLGARCAKGHGGNRRYALSSGQWYECQGCGNFVSALSVLDESQKAASAA